jgi:P-type Ca2+ transporter type 2C
LKALGTTTVLCTDKTGTLTEGKLEVLETVGESDAVWLAARRCNDATRTSDEVDLALLRAAPNQGPANKFDDFDDVGELVFIVPFDPTRRTMTTIHRRYDGTEVITVKGAPENILQRCAESPLRSFLESESNRLMDQGLRVLAVAETRNPLTLSDLEKDSRSKSQRIHTVPLAPIGLVGFGDPIRASASEAIAAARLHGARVIMVTGDNPRTARSVALAAGMDSEPLVTGPQLEGFPVSERNRLLASAAIVARVDPQTKFALIDALHERGEIVAMTGDGVNDAPALQRADIGIAVGGPDATDVARQAAAVVLSDGDLTTVVRAIEHGRRIHRNLRATVSYLLTGNLSELLVIAGCLVVYPAIVTPLLPAQLLWINFVTDTFPALALGVDSAAIPKSKAFASAGFLDRNAWQRVFARAALIAAVVLGSAVGTMNPLERQSQIVASLVCTHLALAFVVRARRFPLETGWWRNRWLTGTIASLGFAQFVLFSVPSLRKLIGIVPVGGDGLLRAAIAVFAIFALSSLSSVSSVSSVSSSSTKQA